MLQTLSFKQGLADFVLNAIGEAKDFECQNRDEEKNRKKPSAFMQRLTRPGRRSDVRAERPYSIACRTSIGLFLRLGLRTCSIPNKRKGFRFSILYADFNKIKSHPLIHKSINPY